MLRGDVGQFRCQNLKLFGCAQTTIDVGAGPSSFGDHAPDDEFLFAFDSPRLNAFAYSGQSAQVKKRLYLCLMGAGSSVPGADDAGAGDPGAGGRVPARP